MEDQLKKNALNYHEFPKPGKVSVVPTKPLSNQLDLSLAYSPGVAYACQAIVEDPESASRFTSRANLVGVVTNGTAVLGLGNIGPLASKPVMEGKGCLFKAFSGIDVFDIELNESDPDKLIDAIAMLEPTLGGINLEDIKAPECFYIEKKLRERMKIPVFHDDQHGTAIISSAAILNSLHVVKKNISDVKLVCSGAGAAAIACLNMLVDLGLRKENILLLDSKGVVTQSRGALDESKRPYAANTTITTLADALIGADIFLGCSAAGVLKPEMLQSMAQSPIILALANPEPEIRPELAKEVRPDCIIATGRSDYPNQVNNVLCFPFIFRGALDVGATAITEEMKQAAVEAIALLARESVQSPEVNKAYGGQKLEFGPDYIIPKPFDPRLITRVAPAVAQAAISCGVSTRSIDINEYRKKLEESIYRTGMIMRSQFELAREKCSRIVFADSEDDRVLQAIQLLVEEKLARPVLLGERESIIELLHKTGSQLQIDRDYDVFDVNNDPRIEQLLNIFGSQCPRQDFAIREQLHADRTLLSGLLVRAGIADGLICGLEGTYHHHLLQIKDIFDNEDGFETHAAMNLLLLEKQHIFICDTYINEIPTAEQLAEMAMLTAVQVKKLGIEPSIAFVSHSNYGDVECESYSRMAQAHKILKQRAPDLKSDGPMHADSALSESIRKQVNKDSDLKDEANILIMPNLDAANITYNILKMTGSAGVTLGPFLLGSKANAHILTSAATVRRVINMAVIASANS